jgi:hypothetical protein
MQANMARQATPKAVALGAIHMDEQQISRRSPPIEKLNEVRKDRTFLHQQGSSNAAIIGLREGLIQPPHHREHLPKTRQMLPQQSMIKVLRHPSQADPRGRVRS